MKTKAKLTVEDLIAKRRLRWRETGSIEYDRLLTNAICDEILDNEELREEIVKRPYLLIECCFTVVNKQKKTVPFFFNHVQADFIKKIETLGTKKPFFILKGRQQGFTSLITAIQLSFAIVRKNFAGFTLADRDDNVKAIFLDKAKQIYNNLPKRLKPTEKFNSVNELYFDKLNSSWRIAAASSNIGRSRTLSFIHYSEVAFFKCPLADLQKSIQESAVENAFCIYETTANGFNDAKSLWDSGSCHNLFYEWYKTPEYSIDDLDYLNTEDEFLSRRLDTLKDIGLTEEQRAWYAKKYSSYIEKSSIKQEYPCSPEEAFVTTGSSIFDKEAIGNYLLRYNLNPRRGVFTYDKVITPIYSPGGEVADVSYSLENIRFVDSPSGYISVIDMPYTEKSGGKIKRKPYVIGADTAGTGQDFFTAKVIDNISGRCVATLHKQQFDEDLFAEQLYCLGKFYNNALIAVEVNYSRHPIRHLRTLGYENLYVSKSLTSIKEESEKQYGFLTTSVSKPVIIGNLVSVMRENIYLETDVDTLREMMSFVRKEDGRLCASGTQHDDLVMASAIARFVSINYSHTMETVDTQKDFLASHFSTVLQNDTYLEW